MELSKITKRSFLSSVLLKRAPDKTANHKCHMLIDVTTNGSLKRKEKTFLTTLAQEASFDFKFSKKARSFSAYESKYLSPPLFLRTLYQANRQRRQTGQQESWALLADKAPEYIQMFLHKRSAGRRTGMNNQGAFNINAHDRYKGTKKKGLFWPH